MTIDELYEHLSEKGYAALLCRHPNGISMLDYHIECDGKIMRICERERGHITDTDLETQDETEACMQYLARVSGRYWHLFGGADAAFVTEKQRLLEAAGVSVIRNDLPEYTMLPDVRYRIFVPGADLKRSQKLLDL